MLERVWGKGNPPTPLVGEKIVATTIDNNLEVPLKNLQIDLPYDIAILLRNNPEKTII